MSLCVIAFAPAATAAAEGTDWRYCMAIWEPTHSTYVTMPFESSASLFELEASYARYLDEQGLRHEPVFCPRSDSEAQANRAREAAIAFNRDRGLSASVASWHYQD